LIEALVK